MPQEQRNWWDRNWKWFLPVSIVGVVALIAAFITAVLFFVLGMMRSSGAYAEAVTHARSSPEVQQLLGEPIEEGYFVAGSIQVEGQSGQASLAVPLHGPKGQATLFVEANKALGQWHFTTMVVELKDTGDRIDLTGSEVPNNKPDVFR